ncbi:MAG: hypothetical protein PHR68_03275 [Candidatus Gracilibacteria bacterium]|nr:hypothetical protein [Candidatus Gracilibacteria bacterium]
MNTTFSIKLDKKLKNNFLILAKKKGLNGSIIIRYFMEKVISNPDILKSNKYLENLNIKIID